MASFCSFLVFHPNQARLVGELCSAAGWSVRFIPDPTKKFRFRDRAHTKYSLSATLDKSYARYENGVLGELLVLDVDESEADNILHLICGANNVVNGMPPEDKIPHACLKMPENPSEQAEMFKNLFGTQPFFEMFTFEGQMPVAIVMAGNAWPHYRLIYAIHKLSQSYETESITPWSTHPREGQIFDKHSGHYADHVRTSIAINLAFSAIEELQLQINSSREKPRWLDKSTFEWNPPVLADIEFRLKEAGIDPKQTISWIVRGDETEVQVEPKRGVLAPYSNGQTVRDLELSLPDAIHASSYLRNFITAHAFGRETLLLGPYEVFNVQNLARSLILSQGCVWNVWTNDLLNLMESDSNFPRSLMRG